VIYNCDFISPRSTAILRIVNKGRNKTRNAILVKAIKKYYKRPLPGIRNASRFSNRFCAK